MEASFKKELGGSDIKSMCDPSFTHWSCFYDGVDYSGSYLRVNLTTDGGRSNSDLNAMATRTGQHWFNFIGCDFPNLDTVVVSINGVDHNTYRRDYPALNC